MRKRAIRRRASRRSFPLYGAVASAAASLVLSLTAAPCDADPPKTYFDHVQHSWAVGAVSLSRELKFRDGRLLAYPGSFDELVRARRGKPRSIMFVYELDDDEDAPPYDPKELFFAPIEVLPRYKYWRDNLPNVPRHSVPGGRRYIFVGDAFEPARDAARAYAITLDMKGKDRWRAQNAVFVDAMLSGVEVLREDGVRHLSRQLPLTRVLDDASVEKLTTFLTGDYPERERMRVLRAVGRAETKTMVGAAETLAGRDDKTAAVALAVLLQLDRPRTPDQLYALLDAETPEVRAWAIEEVAAEAAAVPTAFDRAVEVLDGDDSVLVRGGAATGLGRSRAPEAIAPLAKALGRDDDASRDAAVALATIGTPEAITALKLAAKSSDTNTAVAAVLGLGRAGDACADCTAYLERLRKSHEDAAVRDIIGVVLESGREADE